MHDQIRNTLKHVFSPINRTNYPKETLKSTKLTIIFVYIFFRTNIFEVKTCPWHQDLSLYGIKPVLEKLILVQITLSPDEYWFG